jgi:Cu-processing system permease protein
MNYRLIKYELLNIMRSRWLVAYILFLASMGGLFRYFVGDVHKAIVTLSSIMVVVVPLVTALFTTFYWYASERQTGLVLTQPLSRRHLFFVRWVAVALTLIVSFWVGALLPFALPLKHGHELLIMGLIGTLLTMTFAGLGTWLAVAIHDRMWGVGLAFGIWVYLVLIHDALLLVLLLVTRRYPMDLPATLIAMLNPIGLARVVLMVQQDVAMLLGHSGALVRNLLLSNYGVFFAVVLGLSWSVLPIFFGYRKFRKADF